MLKRRKQEAAAQRREWLAQAAVAAEGEDLAPCLLANLCHMLCNSLGAHAAATFRLLVALHLQVERRERVFVLMGEGGGLKHGLRGRVLE